MPAGPGDIRGRRGRDGLSPTGARRSAALVEDAFARAGQLGLRGEPLRAPVDRLLAREPAPQGQAEREKGHGSDGPGVPLRKVCRELFAQVELPTAAAWRRAVLGLWRGARFREERYGAIELTGVKRFDRFQDMAALPMYEEMIVTGAWWDLVDGIAGHRLGLLLRRFPASSS